VVTGKGHQHPKKGFFGNLNIKIRITGSQTEESTQFRKEGYNTYAKIKISLLQAVLGTRLTYATVWGERDITLQGGCQNGDLIKRSGEGLRKQSKKENGDHFMTL
jgi:molecular chaperone DnaJ